MTSEVFRKSKPPALSDLDEKARRAVNNFRALQPTLTTYAQILTGKKNVRVVTAATDNGSTDGKNINFRPPLALGDPTPHERHFCDKRDEDGLHLCPACRIREEVLVTIYHEIAHICFDSFDKPTNEDKKQAIVFAVKEAKGKWADQIAHRIENAPTYKTRDYINLISLINGYLPFLLNALEDARVNRELFKARPGVKRMFDADTERIFREGFEARRPDGSFTTAHWDEQPLNNQIIIGCFCKASGYDYSSWFHADVVRDLNDEELTSLINQMDTVRNARAVYNLTFKVLARLRELGYCETPQDPDPEPDPEPEEEPDDSAEEERSPDSDSVSSEPGGSGEADGQPSEADADNDEAPEEGEEGDGESSSSQSAGRSEEEDVDESSEGSPEDNSGADSSTESPNEGDGGSDSRDSGTTSEEAEGEEGGSEFPSGGGNQAPVDEENNLDESEGAGSEGDLGDSDLGDSQGMDSGGNDSGEGGEEADSSDDSAVAESHEDASESVPGEGDEEDDEEPLDTGADDGYGGTSVEGEKPKPRMGTVDDLEQVLEIWGNHEEKPKTMEAAQEEDAVDKAVIQGIYFTSPSNRIHGVREHYYGQPHVVNGTNYSHAWRDSGHTRRLGALVDLNIPESILQPALLRMRRAFTDNKRGAHLRNRKSGRVDSATLGKRAWNDDPRLFHKKVLPGKKDYFVVIGMDISGSTVGVNLALEKRAIMAQANVLDRAGIPFAIYAHTGNYHDTDAGEFGLDLEIYHIKDPKEPWSDKEKQRLDDIKSSAANLDGHALEFLRKVCDTRSESDKVIMYYSDGKMPLENYDEELSILTSEIRTCKQKNYTLLGVGIRTDSPRQHGLDTVEVWEDEDLIKVVDHLGKRLSVTNRR